jgi:hypothetical protein
MPGLQLMLSSRVRLGLLTSGFVCECVCTRVSSGFLSFPLLSFPTRRGQHHKFRQNLQPTWDPASRSGACGGACGNTDSHANLVGGGGGGHV